MGLNFNNMKGTFIIDLPEKYIISVPDINGNETNPYFVTMLDKYCDNIIRRGWKVCNIGDRIHAEVLSLSVEELELINMFDGNVQYFCPFIKVGKNDIDSTIPEGLRDRTYIYDTGLITEEGESVTLEQTHTWRTWRDDSHPLGEVIDGYYYFMSATFGYTLSGEELMIIHNSTSAELVDEIPNYENN